MLARIRTITFDCRDPERLGRFWGEITGFVDDPANPNSPGDPEWLLVDPKGVHPNLLFVAVPEPKTAKNRVHLDLQPCERRDAAVERVVAAGATVVADHRTDDGLGWVTLADPEGNELCIERSGIERGTAGTETPARPVELEWAGDDRAVLAPYLDWFRDGVLDKVAGLSDHDARKQPGRTATSIAGIVRHLSWVEDRWVSGVFAGVDPGPGEDEWQVALERPFAESVERYRDAVERSRAVIAAHDLDDMAAMKPVNLRVVLLTMIEETARHLGHLDILRELADGTTGE